MILEDLDPSKQKKQRNQIWLNKKSSHPNHTWTSAKDLGIHVYIYILYHNSCTQLHIPRNVRGTCQLREHCHPWSWLAATWSAIRWLKTSVFHCPGGWLPWQKLTFSPLKRGHSKRILAYSNYHPFSDRSFLLWGLSKGVWMYRDQLIAVFDMLCFLTIWYTSTVNLGAQIGGGFHNCMLHIYWCFKLNIHSYLMRLAKDIQRLNKSSQWGRLTLLHASQDIFSKFVNPLCVERTCSQTKMVQCQPLQPCQVCTS